MSGRSRPWITRPLAASGPGPAPAWRLLVTLSVPAVVLSMEKIRLPGLVDRQHAGGMSTLFEREPTLHVGLLGLLPILTAFVLIEIVAAIVPSLAALRLRPRGRARLAEAVAGTALILAAFQAWGLARVLATTPWAGSSGFRFEALIAATLVGATFFLIVVAWLAGRYGLVGGWSVLAATALIGLARWLFVEWRLQTITIAAAGVAAAVFGAAALLTIWFARRSAAAEGARAPVRLLAAGVVPFAVLWAIPAVAAPLVPLGLPYEWLEWSLWVPGGGATRFVVLVAIGTACTWAFTRRAKLTPRGLALLAVANAFYVVALETLAVVARRALHVPVVDVALAAVVGAVVLDAIDEWRARRRVVDPVDVGPVHRVHDADVALAALEAQGIPAHARGVHHRSLLHFFGPFVPISIFVAAPHAARASEIVDRIVNDPRAS